MAIISRVKVSEISSYADIEGDKKAERVRLYFQGEDDQTPQVRVGGKWNNQPGLPLDLELVDERDWNFFNLGDEYRITIERVRIKRKTLSKEEIDKAVDLDILDLDASGVKLIQQPHGLKINAVYSDGVREFIPTEGEDDARPEE